MRYAQVSEVYEPIEVITFFHDGRLIPLRFRWNGRVYRVAKVCSSWTESRGKDCLNHFSIYTRESSDFFELTFDNQSFSWLLARTTSSG